MKVHRIQNNVSVNQNRQASRLNNITFQALAVTKAAQSDSMFFNNFVKTGQKSVLKFLKDTKMSAEAVFKFLCHSTSDDRTRVNIAKELSANPRKSDGIKQFLVEKLGGDKKGNNLFWTWFHDEEGGYRSAYANFYNNKLWDSAKNLNTIVKQSPNIAPWAFEGKAGVLGQEPVLGNVPEDFGDINTYRQLIGELKESDFHKALLTAKDAMVKEKNNDTMSAAKKANEDLQKLTKPFIVSTNDKEYEAKPIIQSFSAKLIYLITPQENNSQKYILKFDPYELIEETDKARKFEENQSLRADMPYLDALVDFYLKENKSPNAPDIELFDYETKSVLYKATEGEEPVIPEEYSNNLYKFLQYNKISDLQKLGIELSDVHAGNFKVDKDGNYILIDSGHAKYTNLFRPPVIGRHIVVGNLCGRELCK